MKKITSSLIILGALAAHGYAAPVVKIRLPERFRLLTKQLFDLRVEATALGDPSTASIQILENGIDRTGTLPAPEITTDNDADPSDGDKAWTFRAVSFPHPGVKTIVAKVIDRRDRGTATERIGVQDFSFGQNGAIPKKNIILFLGDAMGTAYRDAGRIVAKSTDNRFREGFFDEVQQMDLMPVNGMVMTYALDRVVPDSANAATAWAGGNKTIDGSLNLQPDNNDFKYDSTNVQGTKQFVLDNPRVETLWQYLKRLYGYKTGIVSTADITDATPGGEGGYSFLRALTFDIARQYTDGVWTSGPEFDAILGGGMEHFNKRTAINSGDTRNLTAELQSAGFTYVTNRTALNGLSTPPDKLLGLFYSAVEPVPDTGATGNMNVAYDKLLIPRPTDEPGSNSSTNEPNFNGFTDQPFLDEMTAKAIATLSKGGSPFILMVEGASIDKQSHPNHEAGVVWDTIEFDKAVGVGRAFAAQNGSNPGTLLLVTADHDQSMSIVGLTDTTVSGAVLNTRSISLYPRTKTPYDPMLTTTIPGPSVGALGIAPSNSGNNVGEVVGFPNYIDHTYDSGVYPDNANNLKLAVGFRTGNHTGSSVPITAEGPGALLFAGYFDQTDIFFKMARTLSRDTSQLDEFVQARAKFSTISPNY